MMLAVEDFITHTLCSHFYFLTFLFHLNQYYKHDVVTMKFSKQRRSCVACFAVLEPFDPVFPSTGEVQHHFIFTDIITNILSLRYPPFSLRIKDPPPRIFLDSSKPNPRISHLSIKLRCLLWPPSLLLQLTTNSSLFHFATQANVRGIIWYNAKGYSTVKQNSKLHCWGQTILQWGKFQQSTMQCTASVPFSISAQNTLGGEKRSYSDWVLMSVIVWVHAAKSTMQLATAVQ